MSGWLSAPGWTTAHLSRIPGEPPLTVCGRVMRGAREAPAGMSRCRHCEYSTLNPQTAAEAVGVSEPTGEPPQATTDELSGQEWAAEIERLTAALHAHQCHPDWTYAITTGGSPLPPSGQWGTGWEPNTDSPGHGRGTKPANTWWFWRRPLEEETT